MIVSIAILAFAQNPPAVDQIEVNRAIRSAIEWLKPNWKSQNPGEGEERNLRLDELVLWTFLHAGVSASDPQVRDLLNTLVSSELSFTYNVSLQAMILENVDAARYQGRIAQCAQYLVDNQCENGQWGYGEPSMFVKEISWIDPGESPKGKSTRPLTPIKVKKKKDGEGSGDNSCSQYAALGMRACHSAGILLPPNVVQKAKGWWETSQKKDGGWDYDASRTWKTGYGSMTVGAVGSLLIYHHILKVKGGSRFLFAGMSWLATNFRVDRNPGWSPPDMGIEGWTYYYLYGLERVGNLARIEKIGTRWWYSEGATFLLEGQSTEGSWGESVSDTCFAILFLRRATQPLEDVATGDSKRK